MCRLFGIIADKQISPYYYLSEGVDHPFRFFGKQNPDGCGIGYYTDGKPDVSNKWREPAHKNPNYVNASKRITSNIIISHVRLASTGKKSPENSHPFAYDNWLFVHNGTVSCYKNLKLKLEQKYVDNIKGGTDSEVYFHWILQNITLKNNIIEGIRTAVEYIKTNCKISTGLNFILSDGHSLYGYRDYVVDVSLNKFSLYYLDLTQPKPNDVVGIICSEKLTDKQDWNMIERGNLVIFDHTIQIISLF
jgi:predicted glutamine amidotransferase